MATLKGIDISHWQNDKGAIDFARVKRQVDFCIIKAGFGREFRQIDPFFNTNYTGCKVAGIPVGAYWYSYADSVADAHLEARACINALKGKQFEFPIYYDMEENWQATLGKDLCTKMAEAFCTDLEKAGYFVGIYANTNWFNNYLDHAYLSKKYTIWLADTRLFYNRTLTRAVHQYNQTSCDGINGIVDWNTSTVDFAPIMVSAGLNGYKKEGNVPADSPVNNGLSTIVVTASKGDAKAVIDLCEDRSIPYEVK